MSATGYERMVSLAEVESLLAFHEGSATPEREGAQPTVRINHEDFAAILAGVRQAITAQAVTL